MRSGMPKRDGRDAPGNLVIDGFLGVPPLRPQNALSAAEAFMYVTGMIG